MTRLDLRIVLLLSAVFLLVSAGCVTSWPSSNATPVLSSAANATPAINQGSLADHASFNVLRGEPFTITGTVPDRTMTTVQVWLLNGSISTTLVPVRPDGTFRITLDAGVTSALGRNFTSAAFRPTISLIKCARSF